MLKQRVITAVVLLALLLPALLANDPRPFALLTLLLIAAAAWEWARLNGVVGAAAVASAGVLTAACAWCWWSGWTSLAPSASWWLATAVWAVAGSWALRAGPTGWARLPRGVRWATGMLALWAAWLALAQAHRIGLNFVLSVLCLVWMADIAAYFGGRRFGRRKLAPTISPGKSWEGAMAGAAGVVVLALLWRLVERGHDVVPSLYARLDAGLGWGGLVLGAVALSAMSVLGDLFESLVKRAAGAKDSSALLPGHGGVLDRVDALLPVFPAALALASVGMA